MVEDRLVSRAVFFFALFYTFINLCQYLSNMKLSQWAKREGIHYQTAWRQAKAGKIVGLYKNEMGSYFVDDGLALKERILAYQQAKDANLLKYILLKHDAEWRKNNL